MECIILIYQGSSGSLFRPSDISSRLPSGGLFSCCRCLAAAAALTRLLPTFTANGSERREQTQIHTAIIKRVLPGSVVIGT